MTENIAQLYAEIEQATVTTKDELERYRLRYLSKMGAVTELFEGLKTAAADDRRSLGQQLNGLKNLAQERFTAFQEQVEAQQQEAGLQPAVD
ncbi:MAG TPA: phenylalanine--tRNA ligase subunit alpha, partial [Fibrella sp.]